jgi:hypothetical protein
MWTGSNSLGLIESIAYEVMMIGDNRYEKNRSVCFHKKVVTVLTMKMIPQTSRAS